MEKKTENLLLSILILCFSAILVVGATFALFTDSVTVNNHLQAGNLKVDLYRTAYTENALNAEGFLEEKIVQPQNNVIDDNDVNLRGNEVKWLFEVQNAVPQSYYQATLDLINKGTVALEYSMHIVLNEGETTDLVKQIQITVSYENSQVKSFMLSDCANNQIDLGVLTKGQTGRFSVKAEFINDNDVNNDAMDETVKFHVQVFATQKTTK